MIRKKWHTDIPSYKQVRYQRSLSRRGLAVLRQSATALEYDFIVTPGADPKAIALNIEGARKLDMNLAAIW